MTELMLPSRAVVQIAGPDARTWLQGLVTQDVTRPAPLYAGLLSPQGKLLFDLHLHDDGAGGFLADVAADRAAELVKRLTLYRLRAQVTIHMRPDLAVHAAWESMGQHPADPRLAALGARWIAPTGATPPDDGRYRRWRWHHGVAEGPEELGVDRLLWLETNAAELNGVSTTKGCYVGQENTARMHFRGKVRKRLMVATVSGAGDVVRAGDQAAADVVLHAGDQALLLMRLDYLDAPLTLGGAPATLLRPAWLTA